MSMNIHDPATWPKHPEITYWRISRDHPIAHAVYNTQAKAVCSAVLGGPETRVMPTKGYTRLCARCIGGLRSWGYLSRSEAINDRQLKQE